MNARQFAKLKRNLRRTANEALTVENWGDDGDNFHEWATAQNVLELLNRLERAESALTVARANSCALLSQCLPHFNISTDEALNAYKAASAAVKAGGAV